MCAHTLVTTGTEKFVFAFIQIMTWIDQIVQDKYPCDSNQYINYFKLVMAMKFSEDLMWDVDNKKALNLDDVEIVRVMVKMLRLDFLRDIKLVREQNVVRHVPYLPCLLPPNQLQWSFSTYFVDSGRNSKTKNNSLNNKFRRKWHFKTWQSNLMIFTWNQIFTWVSVNRNEAAKPARSDELKYLKGAKFWLRIYFVTESPFC